MLYRPAFRTEKHIFIHHSATFDIDGGKLETGVLKLHHLLP